MRVVIGALKMGSFILMSLITIPLQTLGLLLFGNTKLFFIIPATYYRLTCLIFGIKVTLSGKRADGHVLYVGNHLSYIDIAAVGSYLNATFISKADVKNWPIFGVLATVGKTVFIERSRDAVTKCIQDIKKTLSGGRSLILFPEGTSTKGTDVIPFKSSVFEILLNEELKKNLIVQPFTITIINVNKRAVQKEEDHDLYAWYGDMEFTPHLWELAKSKGVDILITFHPPRAAADYEDRKAFASDCHKDVQEGLRNTLPPTLDFQTEAA